MYISSRKRLEACRQCLTGTYRGHRNDGKNSIKHAAYNLTSPIDHTIFISHFRMENKNS